MLRMLMLNYGWAKSSFEYLTYFTENYTESEEQNGHISWYRMFVSIVYVWNCGADWELWLTVTH